MPLLAAVEPALPAAELDQILREGLGPLLMGSYGTVCLFTFECLFMCQVSLSWSDEDGWKLSSTEAKSG